MLGLDVAGRTWLGGCQGARERVERSAGRPLAQAVERLGFEIGLQQILGPFDQSLAEGRHAQAVPHPLPLQTQEVPGVASAESPGPVQATPGSRVVRALAEHGAEVALRRLFSHPAEHTTELSRSASQRGFDQEIHSGGADGLCKRLEGTGDIVVGTECHKIKTPTGFGRSYQPGHRAVTRGRTPSPFTWLAGAQSTPARSADVKAPASPEPTR